MEEHRQLSDSKPRAAASPGEGMAPRSVSSDELWKLFDVSCATDERGLAHYLSSVLDASAAWFRATGASIFLSEGDGHTFALSARAGVDAKIPAEAKVRAGEGIAGAAIAAGEPILVEDPNHHALLSGRVRSVRHELGSAMVVPLIDGATGCVGVLNLSRRKGEAPFSEAELKQARPIAGHIALAVTNARLLARLGEALGEARQLRDSLAAVIASVGMGLVVIDSKGTLSTVNPGADALLGNPEVGTAWQSAFRTVPPKLKDALDSAIRAAIRGEQRSVRAHDANADCAWSIVGSPTPEGGVVVAIHDLTDMERAQREMARMARLAEIGQMAAAIAHEIRNPLTGILGAAQVVRDDPDAAAEFGGIIECEVRKLNALCDDFLDFARPLRIQPEPMDLAAVLGRVVDMFRSAFRKAGVGLELTSESAEPIIEADPLRIEQVARNLLSNALQACSAGDRVTVSVGDDWFSVEDSGHGMDNDTIQRLFAPFFTTRPQGTGLGLGNVRKIVDAHGGAIEVASSPGEGTRMTVRFRMREAA